MERPLEGILISHIKQWRCLALLGARQVGKSYLLKEILRKHEGTLLSFDDPREREAAHRDPLAYLERYYHPGKYLFIDEAAKVPEIFSAVKVLVDRYDPKPTGICLSNSGNYPLLRRIKESLAGRVHLLFLHPFSWQEMFGVSQVPGLVQLLDDHLPTEIHPTSSFVELDRQREERMLWGGFPSPSLNADREARIVWARDYVRTYILPLVIEQFKIRETDAFEQAARLFLLQSALFLNVNKLARTVGVSQPTLASYAHFLEAMMVIRRVPVFLRNPKKRLMKQRKIYALDPLLIQESLGLGFSLQRVSETEGVGPLYESFLFNEIQKTIANYDLLVDIFTWRTQDKAEVDIVLSTPKGIFPLEVKHSTRLTRRDASGLTSFLECYPEVRKGYIIYPGEAIQPITKHITAVPDWWVLGVHS